MKVTFSGEIIELTSALLSGKVNDRHGTPTSIYGGPLELDEIHSALYYANRTVIRLADRRIFSSFRRCGRVSYFGSNRSVNQRME